MTSFLDALKKVRLPWFSPIGNGNSGLVGSTDLQAASFIMRGGSWIDYPGECRLAERAHGRPDLADDCVGFRLFCSALPDRPKIASLPVMRGGSWPNFPVDCRSACRDYDVFDCVDDLVGLRLSCSYPSNLPRAAVSLVSRGSSWLSAPRRCCSAFRNYDASDCVDDLVGLRLSCSCPLDHPKMANPSVVRGSGWDQVIAGRRSTYRVFSGSANTSDTIGLRFSCSSLPAQPMAANSPDLSNSPDNPTTDSPDSSNLPSESFLKGVSLDDICHLAQTPVGCLLSNPQIATLCSAFAWPNSPQGTHYWARLAKLQRPFTRSDKVILLDWIKQIEAREAQQAADPTPQPSATTPPAPQPTPIPTRQQAADALLDLALACDPKSPQSRDALRVLQAVVESLPE